MKKIDLNILLRLNRKYSQYGEIFDADPGGSDEKSDIPWNIAKEIILERDNYSCRICGKSPLNIENRGGVQTIRFELEVHHIIPRIAGGTNSTKNLITLCKNCHIKTFKNEYKGLPAESFQLNEGIELFTDSKKIASMGHSCVQTEIDSYFFKNTEFRAEIKIKGFICNFKSLESVYGLIFQNNLTIDEIIIKNKNGDYIIGLIENYQPI